MYRFDEVGRNRLLQAGQLLQVHKVGSTMLDQELCGLGLVGAVPHVDVKLGGLCTTTKTDEFKLKLCRFLVLRCVISLSCTLLV